MAGWHCLRSTSPISWNNRALICGLVPVLHEPLAYILLLSKAGLSTATLYCTCCGDQADRMLATYGGGGSKLHVDICNPTLHCRAMAHNVNPDCAVWFVA